MPMSEFVAALGLLVSSIAGQPEPLHQLESTVPPLEICAVLQTAYTAAIKRDTPAYPTDVRPSTRRLDDLEKFVPNYRVRMAMSEKEFDELAGRESIYSVDQFKPTCDWKGQARPTNDDEGHHTFVTFTNPIYSKNARLALVEVSFREEGIFAYGLICTVRSTRGIWSAQCLQSWIT